MCLLLSCNAGAQLLIKLKKQVAPTVEETIVDKIEKLARKTTSEAFDRVFAIASSTPTADLSMKDFMLSVAYLSTHYDFNWKYTMSFKFKKKRDNIDMTFYLKEDANYWEGAEFKGDTAVFLV